MVQKAVRQLAPRAKGWRPGLGVCPSRLVVVAQNWGRSSSSNTPRDKSSSVYYVTTAKPSCLTAAAAAGGGAGVKSIDYVLTCSSHLATLRKTPCASPQPSAVCACWCWCWHHCSAASPTMRSSCRRLAACTRVVSDEFQAPFLMP